MLAILIKALPAHQCLFVKPEQNMPEKQIPLVEMEFLVADCHDFVTLPEFVIGWIDADLPICR